MQAVNCGVGKPQAIDPNRLRGLPNLLRGRKGVLGGFPYELPRALGIYFQNIYASP